MIGYRDHLIIVLEHVVEFHRFFFGITAAPEESKAAKGLNWISALEIKEIIFIFIFANAIK